MEAQMGNKRCLIRGSGVDGMHEISEQKSSLAKKKNYDSNLKKYISLHPKSP